MSVMGHEEQFSPLTLSVRYMIREKTFAGAHGNGRYALKAAICGSALKHPGSTEVDLLCGQNSNVRNLRIDL
jgi:hypothetical protein